MLSVVTLCDVSFELPNGRLLFEDLSLSLKPGLTALVGPNGVGKSTLARILSGDLEPTQGTVRRNADITFFPQREEPQSVTVDEYLGAVWSAWGESLLQEINHQMLCTSLSGGQWMRVRLARTLDDQFLILDEPTNDLDRNGREAVTQFLQYRGGGSLFISHDRECLALSEDVLELSNRGLSQFGGGWLTYMRSKETERKRLNQTLEKAKQERSEALADQYKQRVRQEKRNRQGAAVAARGGQAKILLGRQKRRAQVSSGKQSAAALDRIHQTINTVHQALKDLKVDPVMYADLIGHEVASQKLVLETQDFNIRFEDWVFSEDLTLNWRGNIRLALKGENGTGKSTLIQALLGVEYETRGEIRRGKLKTLYVDQRCALLDESKTLLENMRESSALTETELRNGLARFLFVDQTVFQKVEDLSGGERLRATLARGFLASDQPELLILDEPTNNLDLANIEFLENIVRQYRGALIIISHDETFLKNCGLNLELTLLRSNLG